MFSDSYQICVNFQLLLLWLFEMGDVEDFGNYFPLEIVSDK